MALLHIRTGALGSLLVVLSCSGTRGEPPAQVGASAPGPSTQVRAGARHSPAGLPAWTQPDKTVGAQGLAPLQLTLDQAVEMALAQNARLRVAAAEALVVRERAQAAGKPDPIRFSLNPATIVEQLEGAISHVLGISKKRKYASRAARHELAAVLASNEEFRLELIAATKSSYWGLAVAQQVIAVLGDEKRRAEEAARGVGELTAAGAVPPIEAERSEAELAAARQAVFSAERQRDREEAELGLLLGLPVGTNTVAVDAVDSASPSLHDGARLVALAMENRPTITQVVSLAEAAKAGVGLAESLRRPELSLEIATEELEVFGRAALEFPLIDFGSIRHTIRAVEASAEAAEAQVELVKQQLRTEVTTSLNRLEEATSRLQTIENDRLPRQRHLLGGATQQYENGAVTMLDVLQARRQLNALLLEDLQARLDVLLAMAGLERTVGVPLAQLSSVAKNQQPEGPVSAPAPSYPQGSADAEIGRSVGAGNPGKEPEK